MADKKSGNSYSGASQLLNAAKKVQEGITVRADAYLEGNYDPGKEARKTIVKGTTTALVVLSVLTGLAFSGPTDINEDQVNAQLRQAPITMDIDDFMNATVEDDDDDADEQKGAKLGVVARFRQAVFNLPQAVRLLIVTPLWAIGTALMTIISFLWNVIFSSPIGAFIASLAVGFAVLFGLFAVTAKMLFPDVPLRKLVNKRNVLALGIAALLLSVLDAVAPQFWHSYPLASAAVKLAVGALTVAVISLRIKSALQDNKYMNMPKAAV